MLISVVIVNYNLSQEILACLASIERHPSPVDHEIIVVDNKSADGKLETLKSLVFARENLHWLAMDENSGFGTACNAGARMATGKFLCFLNPDTLVDTDFLTVLLSIQQETNAALIGPAYGPVQYFEFSAGWFPNLGFELLNVILIGRHLEAWLMGFRRRLHGDKPMLVDWVLGACMFMPLETFMKMDGFDESFFLYFEEVDFCRRLRDTGGQIIFAPSCRIIHIGSVSGKRNYVSFTERFYSGKIRYLLKHYRGARGAVMRSLIWAQLHSQRLLWVIPWHGQPDKAKQKQTGLKLALQFLGTHRRTG